MNFLRYIRLLTLWAIAASLISGCSLGHHYQGYIEGEYVYLTSAFSGILKQLSVARGDSVKSGQLLFVLDPEPESSELIKAKQQLLQAQNTLADVEKGQRNTILLSIQAQREQAKANLVLSKANLQRYRSLLKQGAIDQATVDQAQANYDHDLNMVNQYEANLAEARLGAREYQIMAQQAAVDAAQADVARYTWQLQQKSVKAPTSGLIFDTYYKVGEFVNDQQPVAALLAPENTYLVFYIPEPERSQLHVGQTVYFTCDACQGRASAIINYLSPQAEYTPPVIYSTESRSKLVYRVQARLPLEVARRFYPGQPVDVSLD